MNDDERRLVYLAKEFEGLWMGTATIGQTASRITAEGNRWIITDEDWLAAIRECVDCDLAMEETAGNG